MNKRNSPLSSQTLDEAIKGINKHALPERDLWTGIERAISQQEDAGTNTKSIRPIYAIAASVSLLAFVAMFSYHSGKSISGQELVQQLSEQHLQQKQQLLVSLQGQATLTENWQQQLEELDEAAIAIKKALENEPNNVALLKMLKKVHQQQIMLIERVHAPAWKTI